MKVLFTRIGNPASGSWQVRGVQMAAALGGLAVLNAGAEDIAAADIVVVVKRFDAALIDRIAKAGKPIVYDVVDGWPQPAGNAWTSIEATGWLSREISASRASAVIGSTLEMCISIGISGLGVPCTAIDHHYRPGIDRNPVRDVVRAVGYEGSERYLDGWRPTIMAECERRGWRFVVNPPRLADVDIAIAVRGGKWRGYVTDRWKSNVKIANAQGSGTPIIALPECGAIEASSGGEYFVRSPDELAAAFDVLRPQEERRRRAAMMIWNARGVNEIADNYRRLLSHFG